MQATTVQQAWAERDTERSGEGEMKEASLKNSTHAVQWEKRSVTRKGLSSGSRSKVVKVLVL